MFKPTNVHMGPIVIGHQVAGSTITSIPDFSGTNGNQGKPRVIVKSTSPSKVTVQQNWFTGTGTEEIPQSKTTGIGVQVQQPETDDSVAVCVSGAIAFEMNKKSSNSAFDAPICVPVFLSLIHI